MVLSRQSSDSRHAFKLSGTKLKVIVQNDNQVEIAFVTLWNSAGFPLNVDKRCTANLKLSRVAILPENRMIFMQS